MGQASASPLGTTPGEPLRSREEGILVSHSELFWASGKGRPGKHSWQAGAVGEPLREAGLREVWWAHSEQFWASPKSVRMGSSVGLIGAVSGDLVRGKRWIGPLRVTLAELSRLERGGGKLSVSGPTQSSLDGQVRKGGREADQGQAERGENAGVGW